MIVESSTFNKIKNSVSTISKNFLRDDGKVSLSYDIVVMTFKEHMYNSYCHECFSLAKHLSCLSRQAVSSAVMKTGVDNGNFMILQNSPLFRHSTCWLFCYVKVDAQDNDDVDTEQPTDETLKTEHEVMDVQQVDAVQGVAGTSEDQNGREICVCVDYVVLLFST